MVDGVVPTAVAHTLVYIKDIRTNYDSWLATIYLLLVTPLNTACDTRVHTTSGATYTWLLNGMV